MSGCQHTQKYFFYENRSELEVGWGGEQVTVSGYDHRLLLLADRIMHKLVNFKVNPHRFDFIKVPHQADTRL